MDSFDLDFPLVELSTSTQKNYWTIRHAVEGVQIFGGIGSGKTSGSGRMLALKYLSADFGGLVLTVKPDEKAMWEDYCHKSGRTNDLLIVEPGQKNFFNFLEYEYRKENSGSSITENVVQVLKTVIRASEEKTSGKNDDPFWETALDMLIFNVIDLCSLAYGKISVQQMFEIVQTVPKIGEDGMRKSEEKANAFDLAFTAARDNVNKQVDAWEKSQQPEDLSRLKNETLFEEEICNALPDVRLLKFLDQFFSETFMNLSEKTRSIIDFSFSGFLFRLLRDPVYSLFCRYPSTFTPEDCLNGKIILINLPVKLFHKVGRDCQIMFKYIWQRTMEKRDVNGNKRPVFLWADEAQNFLHEHDADYQATARSSRIATVYISQNLPNYYANMGAKAEFRTKGFLGTLGTKIFHANADIETNRYASDLIGDGLFEDESRTNTAAGSFSSSKTKSYKFERLVRPEQFVQLKTGGPLNDYRVEGYLHQQGNPLLANKNHIKMIFNQNYIPKPLISTS